MKINELTKKDIQEYADEVKCYLHDYELVGTKIYATFIAKNTKFKIDWILSDFDCVMYSDFQKGGEDWFKNRWLSFMFRKFAGDNEFIIKLKKYALKHNKPHTAGV